jgi:serine/threonine protein kinase
MSNQFFRSHAKKMARVFSRSKLSEDKKIVDKIRGTNRGNLYEVVSTKETNGPKKCKNARCRDYALRMYLADSAISKDGINSQFLKQIQGYALHHPNLLEIYGVDMVFDCEDIDNKVCRNTYLLILYELSSGNLIHWLEVHRASAALYDIIKIVNDLFQALYYLHHVGYTHRRLHPDNVLMVESTEGKTNHFIAKLGDMQDLSVFYRTEKDNPLPISKKHSPYTAPEILLDYEKYLPSSDIWSVGILIHEILFGKGLTPFYNAKKDSRLIDFHHNEHLLQKIFEWLGTPDVRWRTTYMHHHNIDFKPKIGMSVKDKFKTDPGLQKMLKETGYMEQSNLLELLIDLMDACLQMHPDQRITAAAALEHPLFTKFHIPITKYPKPLVPKVPCLGSSKVIRIRKEIIQTTAQDIQSGFMRYYPALMAIYIFDRVVSLLPQEDPYKVFCAAYVMGMKLLITLEHPQNDLLDDIRGIVCGNTEENRLIIIFLERKILAKLNFQLFPNEITALPVTMSIFKTLETEALDPVKVLKK